MHTDTHNVYMGGVKGQGQLKPGLIYNHNTAAALDSDLVWVTISFNFLDTVGWRDKKIILHNFLYINTKGHGLALGELHTIDTRY